MSRVERTRALAKLVRWLGPWATTSVPRGVTRTERSLGGPRSLRGYLYEGARATVGSYVVAPGLHHLGADDPRLDRFARVLAASGLLVLVPKLPDHLALRVAPTTGDDLALAFDDLESLAIPRNLPPPAIFSISFGSAPAIDIATRPSHRDRVGPLVLFGGFADFFACVRFAITGETEHEGKRLTLERDPLNSPAVFINLLPWLEQSAPELEAAWRTMIERSWGQMELKRPGARDPIAHDIAASIPAALRDLFLVGCGLAPGSRDVLERAIAKVGDAFAFIDPRPRLEQLVAPTVVVHGRDDDVIPWCEAPALFAAIPRRVPRWMYLTGMYGHTGAAIPKPREIAHEGATLLRVARTMIDAPAGELRRAG